MKRYVSLASALLVGTVVAQKKVAVTEQALVSASERAAAKEFNVAVALEAKKPVYASDVSDLDEKKDVKQDTKPEKKSNVSSNTSARQVAANDDKKSSAKSIHSSVTSARVAAKDSAKSAKTLSKKDGAKSNSVSSATTPEGAEEVDTSVTSAATSEAKNVEAESSVETSNTSDNQQVENSVDSKNTSVASSNTSDNQKVEVSADSNETSAVSSNTSDNQKVEADGDSGTSATSDNTTPEGDLDHQAQSCDSDKQAIFDNNTEQSVDSSATSGAPGMKAGNISEVSSTPEGVEEADDNYDDFKSLPDDFEADNQDITDKDIDDMLMKVYAEKGFLGDCGVNYKQVAVGDTYWCQDKQLNRRVACEKASTSLHLCCVEFDGCDDLDDMKAWRF